MLGKTFGFIVVVSFISILFLMLALPGKGACASCSKQECITDNECGFYCKCFKVDPTKTHGQCLINY